MVCLGLELGSSEKKTISLTTTTVLYSFILLLTPLKGEVHYLGRLRQESIGDSMSETV